MYNKLNDIYYKNLNADDCEVHNAMVGIAKPQFEQVNTLSLSSSDISGGFCYRNGSLSSFYNVLMMKSYACGVVSDYRGYNKIVTQYELNEQYNFGKSINVMSSSSFTADMSSIYVITIPKRYYGDEIKNNSVNIWDASGNRLFYSTSSAYMNNYFRIEPDFTHPLFESLSATVQKENYFGWCIKDSGVCSIWSSLSAVNAAINQIQNLSFSGVLYSQNTTINIVIQPDEFNTTTNQSFIERNSLSADSIANTTYITSVGLWNDYGDLLAVAKPCHPIRKNIGVPVSIKLEYWS